jgi:hypothetical protein
MQNKIEYEEFFRSQICCFEKSIENDSMKFLSAAIVIKYSVSIDKKNVLACIQ